MREVARACTRGTSSNIIYGLALGYKSAIVPVVALAITIWTSFYLCGMFGVAIAALGMVRGCLRGSAASATTHHTSHLSPLLCPTPSCSCQLWRLA